jgi:hypothetical protein
MSAAEWHVQWDDIPAEGAAADPSSLGEDLYWARQGMMNLDVGWYPDCDPTGAFKCVLVEDLGDVWGEPISTLRTRDVAEVRAWLAAEMAKP